MTKPRVLFVDDEPNVLRALARIIRIRRLPWDVAFADRASAAMAELEARPIDVMVTDLAMPEIDGVTLLGEVRARWPQISRVLLSGESAAAQSLRASRVAHQFLAKPCEGAHLWQTVERLARIRGLGLSPAVRAGAAHLASLPSSPAVHAAVRDVLARSADLETLGRLAAADIALTAKLIQLVSTPFFTLAPRFTTVRSALQILGVDVVRAVLSTRETFRPADASASADVEALQERSLAAARHAREHAPPEMADRAWLAAWLHDVGSLVLACVDGQRLAAGADGAGPDSRASVGAYLLALWGLPDDIVDAVAHQAAPDGAPAEHRALAALVHAATVNEIIASP